MKTDDETETTADTELRQTPAPRRADDALRRKRISTRSGLRAGLATTLAVGAHQTGKKPPDEGE